VPRGRAVVARWVDKIYRYPRRRTALATLAGRLAGEFPIASEEMALFFHHLLSGHSAGADGVRANPATGDRTLATAYTATRPRAARPSPPPCQRVKQYCPNAAQAAYARIQWGCKRKVEYCTTRVLRGILRITHGTGN
jgi:hypothetical protein